MKEELANLFIETEKREWTYGKTFRAKHRYTEYDIVAITLVKNCKKDNYRAEFYFKKANGTNVSGFSVSMILNSLNGKMKFYIEDVILKDPNFISLSVFDSKYNRNILNKEAFSQLELKLKTYPYSELFEISNNSFSLKLKFEDIQNYLPYMKKLKLDENILRGNAKDLYLWEKTIDSKIKKFEKDIESLKKTRKEILKKKEIFKNRVEDIKKIIGEDEFASQALIYECTKGSFK